MARRHWSEERRRELPVSGGHAQNPDQSKPNPHRGTRVYFGSLLLFMITKYFMSLFILQVYFVLFVHRGYVGVPRVNQREHQGQPSHELDLIYGVIIILKNAIIIVFISGFEWLHIEVSRILAHPPHLQAVRIPFLSIFFYFSSFHLIQYYFSFAM